MRKPYQVWIFILIIAFAAVAASAQSFRVQCPTSTITHPDPNNQGVNNAEPPYHGPTQFTGFALNSSVPTTGAFVAPVPATVNGAIKCQQISGGDGYSTMADGTQTFMFSFGPLSGLADVAAGHPGTQFPNVFNTPYPGTLTRGDPATTDGATSGATPGVGAPAGAAMFTWNGAVGLMPEVTTLVTVANLLEGPFPATTPATTAPGCPTPTANTVTGWTDAPLGLPVGAQVVIANTLGDDGTPTPPGYAGTYAISCVSPGVAMSPDGVSEYAFQYVDSYARTGGRHRE